MSVREGDPGGTEARNSTFPAMPRHPHPPRKAPPVSIVYERAVAHAFLDAGYDFVRQPDGSLALVQGDHRVPVYKAVALYFEARHPSIIREGDGRR